MSEHDDFDIEITENEDSELSEKEEITRELHTSINEVNFILFVL